MNPTERQAARDMLGQWIVEDRLFDLRDYFAGQAIGGILARNTAYTSPEAFVSEAYLFADAMLKERDKGKS